MNNFEFRVSNLKSPISGLVAWLVAAVLMMAALRVPLVRVEARPGAPAEEFFIISSVNANKRQLVLKHPTEVTELVRVTDRTAYLDEEGKPLRFQDLRAGDTVYVALSSAADGTRVTSRIHKGPMTVDELRRRYLTSVSGTR